MLDKSTIDFLIRLKKNNNKEWFEANRVQYENAKQDFEQLVELLLKELSKIDAQYATLRVKDCTFRMHRDIRFSKNKDPYKTNFGAGFTIGGKKSNLAGFYLHIEPKQCFIGGGLWMLEPDALKKVRQEIDYNFSDFEKIIHKKNFKELFIDLSYENSLVNPPKGYEVTNKAIRYLKLKNYVTSAAIADEDILNKAFLSKIVLAFKTMNPLIEFLNKSISDN